MPTQVIPVQENLLEPYSQRLYAGDTNNKSYIYNHINNLTTVVGEDIIISGCEIMNLQNLSTQTDISFQITPGIVLHDKAMIEFSGTTTLTYKNACNFSANGRFIVFTRFKNYMSNEENRAQFGITYIGNNQVIHEDFNIDTDRIILGVITLDREINDSISNALLTTSGYIIINNKTYNIRPFRTEYPINYNVEEAI